MLTESMDENHDLNTPFRLKIISELPANKG